MYAILHGFELVLISSDFSVLTTCHVVFSKHRLPCLQDPLCFLNIMMFHYLFPRQSSSGDLMIRNIQLKHSGKYVCMVQTGVDSVSSAAELIVRGKQCYLLCCLKLLHGHCSLEERCSEILRKNARHNIEVIPDTHMPEYMTIIMY